MALCISRQRLADHNVELLFSLCGDSRRCRASSRFSAHRRRCVHANFQHWRGFVAEAGGPTTHAGIFYQNTIAGLYLGRMLDLGPRSARDRVTRVRLEAPEAVDDLVAEMG